MKNPLEDMAKDSVRIGDTLEVFIGNCATEKAAAIKKGLASGHLITHRDGSKEFITHVAVVDLTKVGSAMFTWDSTGDRVKQNKIHVKVSANGERTDTIVATVFRNW